jgi:hypothetical protein
VLQANGWTPFQGLWFAMTQRNELVWLALLAVVAAARPTRAMANGRMPQSIKVVFRPGSQTDILLGVTFGFILSRDDGATWRWGCESAVGFQGTFDPDYELTPSGAILATTFTGLRLTRDGCEWSGAPAPLAERLVTAVTVGSDGTIYAGAADPVLGSGIFKSIDDGASFQPTGAIGQMFDWFDTLEVAPGDSQRVYATGYRVQSGLPRRSLMLRSVDGGQTWESLSTAAFMGTDQSEIKIGAISPIDPDVVFVRVTLVASTIQEAIYRTSNWTNPLSDGGPTWTKVLELPAYLPGVEVRQSGEVLVAATSMGVYRSTNGGITFETVPGPVYESSCLVERPIDQSLWMCANQNPPDRLALGSTADPTTGTWTARVRYDEIDGPVRCQAGTPQHDECEVALWCGLKAQFGNTSGEGDCNSDAGTGSRPPEKGCCEGTAAPGAELGVAMVIAGVIRRRRRTSPSKERP